MSRNRWLSGAIIGLATLWLLLSASAAPAQSPASRTPAGTQSAVDHSSPLSDKELGETQDQLLRLLLRSPRLSRAVAGDASLLADQEYVSRRSPELARATRRSYVIRTFICFPISHLLMGRRTLR